MSIEKLLGDLIDAVNANTEALKAGGGAASSGKGGASDDDKPAGRGKGGRTSTKSDDAPKYTADQVKAAAVKVKEELGTKAAKDLIKKHGADELAKLDPKVYGAFIDEANELLAGGNDDNDDKDDL
jgi:hypothetical protein